jgi:hypothetical protein
MDMGSGQSGRATYELEKERRQLLVACRLTRDQHAAAKAIPTLRVRASDHSLSNTLLTTGFCRNTVARIGFQRL